MDTFLWTNKFGSSILWLEVPLRHLKPGLPQEEALRGAMASAAVLAGMKTEEMIRESECLSQP